VARRPAITELLVEHTGTGSAAADASYPSPAESDALALRSQRAAAMEQIAMLAATALRAPLVFIALAGDDGERACFVAGEDALPWTARDEAAFWGSGLLELLSGGPVELRDLTRNQPVEQLRRFAGLRIGSLLGVPIRSASDHLYGVIGATYAQPTVWNEDDADMLQQFARMAASDLELRRVVDEHAEREQRLAFYVDHDPLTGLSTRAVLLERLREALERPPMQDSEELTLRPSLDDTIQIPSDDLVAVFYLDIDDFREVNERYGHRVGDRMLATVGRRLHRAAGRDATVARLAGVQFAVLMERMTSSEAVDVLAEDLRSAVAQPISVGTEQVSLSVSVGAVSSATTARLAEHLLHGADHAMAHARRELQEEAAVTPSASTGVEVARRVPMQDVEVARPVSIEAAPSRRPRPAFEALAGGGRGRPSRGWLANVRRMWQHLTGMIREAAEYATVDAGMVRFRVESVPLKPLFDELREEIVPDVYARGVRYHPGVVPDDLAVRADPAKVRKVLRQLVSNAVKFTGQGGEVRVRVEPVGPVVHIHVRDMGPGIPGEKLGRVFDPYFAVNRRALAWTDRGLGLGLAITRRYAEGMAGAVHAESEVESGSTFTLTLLRA
jgi:diguanylate cyclase (GGDEF)-like protein